MTPAAALITGLVIALCVGGLWVGLLMRRRARFETAEGLAILSGMRWRELSNLVVDALAASGFERETAEQRAARGMQTDVVVYRAGQPWILTCRQGVAHRVTAASVEEFARQVRSTHAVGGLVVTPGGVEPQARLAAANVELVDGDELWRLVGPLLPPSVHGEVTAHARARLLRSAGVAVAVSAIAAMIVGFGLARLAPEDDDAVAVSPVAATSAPRASNAARTATAAERSEPAAPMSEDEEREAIVHEMAVLPGVDKALWSTRSTLQVYLSEPAVATDDVLCAVMKRHELLRASRLQLQATTGAERPVRFMQCAVY